MRLRAQKKTRRSATAPAQLGVGRWGWCGLAALGVLLSGFLVQQRLAQHDEEALMHDVRTALPQWLAFSVGIPIYKLLETLPNIIVPAPIRTLDLSLGIWRSQVIATLAELGVADLLAEGPKTAEELAALTKVKDPSKLFRLMRAAVGLGVFRGDAPQPGRPGLFRNNRLSAVLRADHPNSVKWMISVTAVDMHAAWGVLKEGLQTGQTPFYVAQGEPFWSYLADRPERDAVFSKAMAAADGLGIHAISSYRFWHNFDRFIDVGGAHGSFLAEVLQQNARLQGVLFDQPQVAKRAEHVWATQHADLVGRTQFIGGSFFNGGDLPEAVSKGDVYVLLNILHDWPDEQCVRILSAIKAALRKQPATLALVEHVLAPGLQESLSMRLLEDITMMVTVDGKERTLSEWRQLLSSAGFDIVRVHAVGGVFNIVEARVS